MLHKLTQGLHDALNGMEVFARRARPAIGTVSERLCGVRSLHHRFEDPDLRHVGIDWAANCSALTYSMW
jgi:hypothetical protein